MLLQHLDLTSGVVLITKEKVVSDD